MITNDHEAIGTSEKARKACALSGRLKKITVKSNKLLVPSKCQARKGKAQRKHVLTAILAWIVMHVQAFSKAINLYMS